ncbi:peptide-methionine (S)-S-oxide reductase MsrA [Flavobacteriaceae bacterium]|nr:peptide-methionine (S)-S-oxide reductase MsrA [Flavobacteriaceae bacterium]
MKNTLLITVLVLITNCTNAQKYSEKQNLIINSIPIEVNTEKIHKAYFASGCFWCVEAIYESIIGVNEVISGYSGGFTSNPTYDIVNTQTTGHAETIEVIYNPKLITFSQLVDVYFGTQNIEQINGQGPDNGTQYRSIIFYQNENQKNIISKKIKQITETLKVNVASESYPFLKFWKAEKYHQDFKKNNKFNSYIINVSDPRFKRFKYKFSEIIKQNQ